MGNMSYCRFENTSIDIADCIEALNDGNWDLHEMMDNASSPQEASGIKRFIKLCHDVSEGFEDEEI